MQSSVFCQDESESQSLNAESSNERLGHAGTVVFATVWGCCNSCTRWRMRLVMGVEAQIANGSSVNGALVYVAHQLIAKDELPY